MHTKVKLLSIILSAVMILSIICAAPITASATVTASGTFENISYKIEDGVLTVSGTGDTGGTYGQTKPWSEYKSSITKIVVSDGITKISDSLFISLSKVTEVSLPNSLKEIGEYAFSNDSSLESVTFPESLETVKMLAFSSCSNLKKINFPPKCAFGAWAFMNCGFTTLTIPSSYVGTIDSYCFYSNENLRAVSIGSGVNLNCRGPFASCDNLRYLMVDNDNPYVCDVDNVLYTKDLSELIFYAPGRDRASFTIPNGVKTIGGYSFDGVESLTKLTIPEGVTVIEQSAFKNCTNLTDIDFPDSLEKIEANALLNTGWLKNQPEGLIYIGKIAFKMKGYSPATVILKSGTKKIAPDCFSYCSTLKQIVFSDTLGEIGEEAFNKCTQLNNVIIPDSVKVIENSAFYDCDSLTKLKIGKGITKLNPFVFAMCDKLEEVVIPDSVTCIDEFAFHGDSALKKLTIPASATDIRYNAFGFLTENNKYVKNTNLTVYGYTGSAAELYCKNRDIKFVSIGKVPIGDVNGDGSVDVLDAAAVQMNSTGRAGLTNSQLSIADVNNDKIIDVLDAAEIQKYAAGIIKEFKKK